jgi:ABC-2 type transport system permease protein
MLRDAWLIVMKEYREVLLRMGTAKANLINIALILGVFGVFMPLGAGYAWVSQPLMPLAYSWLPLFLVSALVADSFAGERERHTLETLLTSALSDGAILLGKLFAAVLYGYGALLVVMGISLITVNTQLHTWRRPVFYRLDVFLTVVVLGFLVTLLIAAIGVLVSLKASTVRQAAQALSLGILGIVWIPALIVGYAFRMLPQPVQERVLEWAVMVDGRIFVVAAALILVVVDAVLLAFAAKGFKRARLVFD